MKRMIRAAEEVKENEYFQNLLDTADDNFDYLLDGLDKLSRDGKDSDPQVVQIATDLNTAIDELTARIADIISADGGNENED